MGSLDGGGRGVSKAQLLVWPFGKQSPVPTYTGGAQVAVLFLHVTQGSCPWPAGSTRQGSAGMELGTCEAGEKPGHSESGPGVPDIVSSVL